MADNQDLATNMVFRETIPKSRNNIRYSREMLLAINVEFIKSRTFTGLNQEDAVVHLE